VLVGLAACDAEGVGPVEESDPGVVLVADVELTRHCDRVGAVEVQIRARRIGCEQPTPCTQPAEPPETWGDRATCPSGESTRWMGVSVDRAGRYLTDVVVRFATGDPVTECLSDAGDREVLVTSDDLDAGGERILAAERDPCPAP
jgi:hypothetical protein